MYDSSTSAVVLGWLLETKWSQDIGSKRVATLYAYIVLTFFTVDCCNGHPETSLQESIQRKQESKWWRKANGRKEELRKEGQEMNAALRCHWRKAVAQHESCHLTPSWSIPLHVIENHCWHFIPGWLKENIPCHGNKIFCIWLLLLLMDLFWHIAIKYSVNLTHIRWYNLVVTMMISTSSAQKLKPCCYYKLVQKWHIVDVCLCLCVIRYTNERKETKLDKQSTHMGVKSKRRYNKEIGKG